MCKGCAAKTPQSMKSLFSRLLGGSLFGLLACGSIKAVPFTPGNVVIYRAGDGAGTLVNTGNAVFLDEYTPAGTLVQSIALPTTTSGANKRLVASGTATSEGLLTRSVNGQYLVATGYDATPPNASSLTSSASATVNRVIGRIDAAGNVNTTTALTDAATANNPRGATSIDGSAFWFTGGAGGMRYALLAGTTSTQINTAGTPITNLRQPNIFGGQLYVTTGSGSAVRLGSVGTGAPTTDNQTITPLPGIPTSGTSPYAFFFADLDAGVAGVDTLYIADDGAAALTKFSLVSGTWTSNGVVGVAADAYRGLTGVVNGTTVTLYAVQAGLRLVSLTDASGYNGAFAGTPTLLATAGTNTAFRGVALSPVEPPQLIVTEINSNASGGDFWELTNVGVMTQDIGNWKWDDDSANPSDPAAVTIPAGTMIAPGESVVFTTAADAAAFRTVWSIPLSVQVFANSSGPSFGQNDQVHLFNAAGTSVTSFSYLAGGFTKSDGSAAAGGHAGVSAGGIATDSAVIDPNFGFGSTRRYTSNVGNPGSSGLNFGGGPSITLSIVVSPSSFSESATNPAATGTVSRATSGASDLVVNLSSGDTTEATVPATVTILAGQLSANFDVTAVDDTFPDGNKTVTITATATDATAPTTQVTVQDDGDVLDTSFLLTEVLSQQAASGVNDFWELTNVSSVTKDISGYSWHDSGRSASAAAAYKLPAGSTIAAGESVIFTTLTPAAFRTWWGIPNSVQVFQTVGAPGLGQNDGVSFFDSGRNELFFFNYAAGGFTRGDGNASTGGHAGPSAGAATETQSAVWVPSSGTSTPRYTFATVNSNGAIASAANAADIGSPGISVGPPTVSLANASVNEGNSGTTQLSLPVTRSDTTTAFTVDYAVTGGTATSGTDYVALASGTLTFTAGGSASQNIDITVNGDMDAEPDETIIVTLSNVVNTTGGTVIETASGTGTIVNDDVVSPTITTQPMSVTIATGYTATLSVSAAGFPAPGYQWYQGMSGDTSTPVGMNSSSFTTPVLTMTTSYWVRATNAGGNADSNTATVTVTTGPTSIDLSNYVRIGRYDLPEPTRTTLPAGTPSHNLLCQEASAVTYNWDTDTLFVTGDGGRAITQVSKTGQLIDTMTLALGSSPQGTDFYDPEGLTYIGGGQFVLSEERDRQLVKLTYVAGTTLSRSGAQTVKIGTFVDNIGTEGVSWDPQTSGFICVKELSPIGIFQTGVDFAAGTATNGSPTTVNSINLFDPALLGMTDTADVFALSNLPSMTGQPQVGNLLVIGQEDARIVNVDRTGVISSTLNIRTDLGNPLTPAGQQHEGVTMDRAGILYVVNENGGGSIDFPQLWVYAPATQPNQPPTAVIVDNAVNSLPENTNTASRVKLGDIFVTDDGLGTNSLSLSGADAASFELSGTEFYLKAGVSLDFETKPTYEVAINADDTTVGSAPDASVNFTLTLTDVEPEAPPAPVIIISEVAPWASSNSAVAADWFEITNVTANPITITGWKIDDSSASFATAATLTGVNTLAPGESAIFIETADLTAAAALFRTTWFGANPPAGLQIGSYTGSDLGLSSDGDGVNIYNAAGTLMASVTFGAADAVTPFQTFDNTLGINAAAISQLSLIGTNGAAASSDGAEIGSPGFAAPGQLRITEVAAWGSGNGNYLADWFEVTNFGARAVDISGWKMDDSSESPAAALPLTGITSIAPGESVIFIETATAASTIATFRSTWFGANPPPALQIGSYTGSGAGLSTGGDAVVLYDVNNVRQAKVFFGASPLVSPFATFENAAGADNVNLTTLSAVGVNGAFVALTDADEIGSPGAIFNSPTYTLQLLHLADGEAGLLASQTAPLLAAMVDAFDGTFANTLILAGGDNFIPGPFAAAGTDALVAATHTRGNNPFAADIEIHNRIGVEASTVGNHEFDFGTAAFSDAINDTTFPYLTANLDFSGDSAISARFLDTVGTGLEEASSLPRRIVPSAVVTKGGQTIGLVGATTQIIERISSTGNVEVRGFAGDGLEVDDMPLLASQLQPVINDLRTQGVNKIVLMAHLQQLANERALAPLLEGVDIILAAGSNTRLGDANDVAVSFPGHAANFADTYPIRTAGSDGKPTLIVNTDNEFTYLGRLVVDFDAAGEVILPLLSGRSAINGAYASTAANVAAAWGTTEANLETTAFAAGTKGKLVRDITNAVQGVISAKDSVIGGFTNFYLEGERNFVRAQETNLGNITADANTLALEAAAPGGSTPIVSLKNGGGIRAQVGSTEVGTGAKLPPQANPAANKPAGAVSQLDVENALRFNNRLMVCETTPAGLKAMLEHGVAVYPGQGRFPHVGGVSFAWDPMRTAGDRITSISLVDDLGAPTHIIYKAGPLGAATLRAAPAMIRIVTLNFLANNGDGYPSKVNCDNFRFILSDGTLGPVVPETDDFASAAVIPANALGEQAAFMSFLQTRHPTLATAYDVQDTAPADDTRIQIASFRPDGVLPLLITDTDGDGLSDVEEALLGTDRLTRFTAGDVVNLNLAALAAAGNTLSLTGTLPAGLTFNPGTMTITGTLGTASGLFNFTIEERDGSSTLINSYPFELDLPSTTFTLQLLHLSDGEAGLLAPQTAPNLAALVDAFDDDYANTLIVSGGDNFIPSPFLNAGTDPALNAVPSVLRTAFARPDIAIHNLIGVEASAIGNHEWDLGSNVFMDAIRNDGTWVGAQFPMVSANLDYSLDSAALARFTNVTLDGTTNAVPEASAGKGRLVPMTVITKGSQKIGIVGVTTQLLRGISSPSGTFVKGYPAGTTAANDMDQLAGVLQPYVNELIAEGVNKIVLLAHLQQLSNEQLLATKLRGVDIIVAAGSNTRLGDADDVAVAFPGHAATFADTYPLVTAGADTKPVLIVNTDNEYTYLGRLVTEFDAAGEIIVSSLAGNVAINGAYAATAANVAAAWGVTEANLPTTAFAAGTKGAAVKQVTDAVQSVISAKDGLVFGYTAVYLEGERAFVRSEETNLGNITADANQDSLRRIVGGTSPIVSLKNGGGIRAQIGAISSVGGLATKLPPVANPAVGKSEGGISQLDIENALRFNNRLMAFETTPAGLKAILEHGVAVYPNQGRFPQIGGVAFAWNPTRSAGNRITSISLMNDDGSPGPAIYKEGPLSAAITRAAPAVITVVTLNFLANDGDGYPIKANGSNFRYLLDNSALGPIIADETLNFTVAPQLPGNALGEQKALADFLTSRHGNLANAYRVADTSMVLDQRIQNLSQRADTVPPMLGTDTDGDGLTDIEEQLYGLNPLAGLRVGDTLAINLGALGTAGSTFRLVGKLPTGLSFNATTGQITGQLLGTPGNYQLQIQELQNRVVINTFWLNLTIAPVPGLLLGSYQVLLENGSGTPRGLLDLNLTKAGSWTGSLSYSGLAKRPTKGTFALTGGSTLVNVVVNLPATSKLPAATVTVTLDSASPLVSAAYTVAAETGSGRGARLANATTSTPITQPLTVLLDSGVQDGVAYPAGMGSLRGTSSTRGALAINGQLGDGKTVTMALKLTVTGQTLVWAQPYANKQSYIGGVMLVDKLGQPLPFPQRLVNGMEWFKAADVKELAYDAGFAAPLDVTALSSRWTAPATSTVLATQLGLTDSALNIIVDGAGLDSAAATPPVLPTSFLLSTKFALTTSQPVSPSPVPWRGSVTRTNGAVAGSFTLPAGASNLAGASALTAVLLQNGSFGDTVGGGLTKVPVAGKRGAFRTASVVFEK
jgi:2',3'-cyclic-nucleotide 2'-phosphodiesterase (5'-nucleotidase family)/uncharacterized protein YjiK